MKTTMTMLLVLLLAGTFAVAAFAQEEDAPAQAQEQLKERVLNYDEANGEDAFGGIVRNGGDYVETGGPHGPVGPGPDEGATDGETVEKLFIDEDGDGFCDLRSEDGAQGDVEAVRDRTGDGDMTRDGETEMETREQGPGEAGPWSDNETGFGTANDQEDSSETADPVRSRGAGKR